MKQISLTLSLAFLIALSVVSCNSKPEAKEVKTEARTQIEMVTTKGTIILELYDETPLHRDNFIKLANQKAYDSLLFHRVIKTFMIQGGDPESRYAAQDSGLGEGDLDYTINAEFNPNLFHKKGVLAAAREDRLDRASSGIQFYIVQGKVYNDSLLNKANETVNNRLARHYAINDPIYRPLWDSLQKAIKDEDELQYELYNDSLRNAGAWYTSFDRYTISDTQREVYKTLGGTPTLDQNYTVYGEVIKGLEVVDSVAASPTNDSDRPVSDVRILSVRVLSPN